VWKEESLKTVLTSIVLGAVGLVPGLLADPYPLTTAISLVQNGGPTLTPLADGNNLWDTNLTWTNNGSTELGNIYFVNTYACTVTATVNTCAGGGNDSWNNTNQQWNDGVGDTVAASNAAFNLLLDPSLTNIPIPGYLNSSDSMPAFLIALDLKPGQSVTTDVNFELSPNINTFFFNGSVVGSPVPEPTSILLLASLALGVGMAGRRKLSRG
jgi:hypothetical protein